MTNKIPAPLAVIPLDGTPKLKVEPSFSYLSPDRNLRTFRKYSEVGEGKGGLDISVYNDDRLCLPDKYCFGIEGRTKGVEWVPDVDRGLSEGRVREVFPPIVRRLTKAIPSGLVRVYGIGDVDINPFGFDLQKYDDRLKVELGVDKRVGHMLVFSEDEFDPKLVESFWLRGYPEGRICGKYHCNNLSIFFIDPRRKAEFKRDFLKYAKDYRVDPSLLIGQSEAAIMNGAYGYRMRVHSSSLDFADSLVGLVGEVVGSCNGIAGPRRKSVESRQVRNLADRTLKDPSKNPKYFFKVVSGKEAYSDPFRQGLESGELRGVEDISVDLTPEAVERVVMDDYLSIFRDARRIFGDGAFGSYPDSRGRKVVARVQLYEDCLGDVRLRGNNNGSTLLGYAVNGKSRKVQREFEGRGYNRFEPNFEPLRGVKADGTPGPIWTEKLFSRNHMLTDLRPWSYDDLRKMLVK